MNLLHEYIRSLLIETAIGQCYPHVVKMAKGSSQEEFADLTRFKVAHGRVTDKYSGESVQHAWVEKGDMIFDWQTHSTKPDGISKDVYYDMYAPEIHNEYTAEETMVNCLKSGQAGPWTMQESVSLEQERQTELEKIQSLFVHSGVQAVELGAMVIPDEPEVGDMRNIVDATKDFLKVFENPSSEYRVRQHERDLWNREMTALINDIYAGSGRKGLEGPGGPLINMMFELGQAYINSSDAIREKIRFPRAHEWLHRTVEDAATWAGASMPKIPEERPK